MIDAHAVATDVAVRAVKLVNDASGASLTQAQFDAIVADVRAILDVWLAVVFALVRDPAALDDDDAPADAPVA